VADKPAADALARWLEGGADTPVPPGVDAALAVVAARLAADAALAAPDPAFVDRLAGRMADLATPSTAPPESPLPPPAPAGTTPWVWWALAIGAMVILGIAVVLRPASPAPTSTPTAPRPAAAVTTRPTTDIPMSTTTATVVPPTGIPTKRLAPTVSRHSALHLGSPTPTASPSASPVAPRATRERPSDTPPSPPPPPSDTPPASRTPVPTDTVPPPTHTPKPLPTTRPTATHAPTPVEPTRELTRTREPSRTPVVDPTRTPYPTATRVFEPAAGRSSAVDGKTGPARVSARWPATPASVGPRGPA
jgi:hypothetical protein